MQTQDYSKNKSRSPALLHATMTASGLMSHANRAPSQKLALSKDEVALDVGRPVTAIVGQLTVGREFTLKISMPMASPFFININNNIIS